MADRVEGEGSNGGGSGEHERRPSVTARARAGAPARAAELAQARRAAYDQARAAYAHARGYDHALAYAHLGAYVSLAVKASGLLALLLSTVILLGGYVQSLGKQDFFCIMAITVIQAAGIFQDWETNLQYLSDFWKIYVYAMDFLIAHINALALVAFPFAVLVTCVLLFYLVGPLACAAISSWRIAKLNHGNNRDGTDSTADMMATLNIFYSLIIFQGTMFLVLLRPMDIYKAIVARRLQSLEQLSEEWVMDAIDKYLSHISTKCRIDPLSIKGMDLIKYAAELLDSESQEDYLCGARLLSAFIKKREDVSWVLLPSRKKIQRPIESLMISSSSSLDEACVQFWFWPDICFAVIDKKEIRELAAAIVAHVAVHIDDLFMYPGAMRCISSLLQHQEETTQTYRNWNRKQVPDPSLHQRLIRPLTKREHYQEEGMRRLIHIEETGHIGLKTEQQRMVMGLHRHRHQKREGGTSNELVQQGLTILERLASNINNRRLICGAPGLLPKITAPLYSATLIEDVKTRAWTDIVTRCLKVLNQLIRAPVGWTSRMLRHQIASDVQALSNLKSILLAVGNDEADHQELKLVATEILTELALDLSINITEETKKVLVTQQLQLFLLASGDDEEESAAIAGRALVSLSTNSESNSALIMSMENDIIGRLTGILDHFLITRRTLAAEIMANLSAHSNVDNMKEILPKVLRKIMSIKTKSQQRNISADQNNPALGDEENQENSVSRNDEETHSISTDGMEEISDQERDEQEAFLSLAQVICDKLNSADLDGAIQNAVQNENNAGSEEQRREAFVDKLKTIIDENRHPTADCLRIVKLCDRIAKSVMRCEQYVEIFRNKGFKSSLSEASKTMSELESCMLFVGTDFGHKKTVRPLFSEIEESFGQI